MKRALRIGLPLAMAASGWLALTACALPDHVDAESSDLSDTAEPAPPAPPDEVWIRIDALPSQLLDSDGGFRALPHSTPLQPLDGPIDAGTLRLSAPALLEGEITAQHLTPQLTFSAQLPHVVGPLQGELSLRKPHTVQQYRTRLDPDGLFATEVLATDDYELIIVPDDPMIPMYLDLIRVPERPDWQAIQVDYGVAVWGQVTDGNGTPVVGAAVHAHHELARGASTFTDSQGMYQLRVPVGHIFQVVSRGRAHGRDPILTSAPFEVDDHGLRVDLQYADLQHRVVGGTVVDPAENRLDGVKVRFESEELAGYEADHARHTVEAVTANGTFDVRLLEGRYQMVLVPPEGRASTLSAQAQIVEIDPSSTDFGTLTLPTLTPLSGRVVDPWGLSVPDARITCRDDLGAHSYSTYADPDGNYLLALPQVPFRCTLSPPGFLRKDLATTHLWFSGDPEAMDPVLRFEEGERVEGRVEHREEGPEASAVIEVRDEHGELLGSTLTEPDGSFSLRVAPRPMP